MNEMKRLQYLLKAYDESGWSRRNLGSRPTAYEFAERYPEYAGMGDKGFEREITIQTARALAELMPRLVEL